MITRIISETKHHACLTSLRLFFFFRETIDFVCLSQKISKFIYVHKFQLRFRDNIVFEVYQNLSVLCNE